MKNETIGDRYSPYQEWGCNGPGLREARDIEFDAGDAAAAYAAHQEASAAAAAAYAVAYAEAAAKAEERRMHEDESDVGDRFE